MAFDKSNWGHRVEWFWDQSYLLKVVWERTEQVCSVSRMRRCLLIHCCSATWPFTKARSRGRSLDAASRDWWRWENARAQNSPFAQGCSNQNESACLSMNKRWDYPKNLIFSAQNHPNFTKQTHPVALVWSLERLINNIMQTLINQLIQSKYNNSLL